MPDEQTFPDSPVPGSDATPRSFACTWTERGLDAAWVHLAGELDVATTPVLRRTLLAPQLQARMVVLDLRELDFIDGVGVHAIVMASIRARRAGRRLVLVPGPPNISRVFTLTGATYGLEIGEIDVSDPIADEVGGGRA
jgi:anti-anti-sigma factor